MVDSRAYSRMHRRLSHTTNECELLEFKNLVQSCSAGNVNNEEEVHGQQKSRGSKIEAFCGVVLVKYNLNSSFLI